MTEYNDINSVTLAIVYHTASKRIWYVSNGMAITINIIHVLHSSANAHKRNEMQLIAVRHCHLLWVHFQLKIICLCILCFYSNLSTDKTCFFKTNRKEKRLRNRQTSSHDSNHEEKKTLMVQRQGAFMLLPHTLGTTVFDDIP